MTRGHARKHTAHAHLPAGTCCRPPQGRFEAAIDDYTRAIELNPGHCRAYYNRAFSRDRLGRCEEAVADYTRALEIEPGNPAALHNRGSLFERLGRCAAATVVLERAGLFC